MQEAKLLHIEDDEGVRATIEFVLSMRGVHKVVAWAESIGQAFERLEEVKDKRLAANVILLDDRLKGGAGLNHPVCVIAKMKDLELDLPVVGLSFYGLAERGLVVGKNMVADLTKDGLSGDIRLLDHVLDELPEPDAEADKRE